MPPRRLKNKSIKRLVEKRMAKAIEEYEKSKANLDSTRSSGENPGNAGGTMNTIDDTEYCQKTGKNPKDGAERPDFDSLKGDDIEA
ncbi:hypothetical protein Tco_0785991 [Tanacetum coccineum]